MIAPAFERLAAEYGCTPVARSLPPVAETLVEEGEAPPPPPPWKGPPAMKKSLLGRSLQRRLAPGALRTRT